jgi:hypothetical protein
VREDGRIVDGEKYITERNGRSSWEWQGIVTFCTIHQPYTFHNYYMCGSAVNENIWYMHVLKATDLNSTYQKQFTSVDGQIIMSLWRGKYGTGICLHDSWHFCQCFLPVSYLSLQTDLGWAQCNCKRYSAEQSVFFVILLQNMHFGQTVTESM